jgi:hypothetical protein
MDWLDEQIRYHLQLAGARQRLPVDGRKRLLMAARHQQKTPCKNNRRASRHDMTTCTEHLRDQARFSWSTRISCWMMDTGVIL